MTGGWAVLALFAAGCGRVAFDPLGDVGEPSFDRDFARGERDGFLVQRASPASYVDASGVLRVAGVDEPRFDHDPITGEPLGLLIESARTNLVIDSEALESSTEWFTTGTGSVVRDTALAPDGTMTADEVIDQDTIDDTRRGIGITVDDGVRPYAFSVYVRAGTRNIVSMGAELIYGVDTLQAHMTVDLASGTVVTPPSGVAAAFGVEPGRDGWYRLWISVVNNGTGNTEAILSVWSNREALSETGSVYAWGAQIEQGPRPSSYIPTTSAPVTRSPDDVTSNAPWLVTKVGTLLVSADVVDERLDRQPAVCLVGPSPRACIDRDGNVARSALTLFGGAASALHGEPWSRQTPRVVIAAWSTAGIALWDGSVQESSSTVAQPVNRVRFGGDGSSYLDGHLRRVTYWPERIASGALPALGAP